MGLSYSRHALRRMQLYGIQRTEVDQAVAAPAATRPYYSRKTGQWLTAYFVPHSHHRWIRVLVDTQTNPPTIVSVHPRPKGP